MSSKTTTRHAISVRGVVYHRLKIYCEKNKASVAATVEGVINQLCEAAGIPEQTTCLPKARRPEKKEPEDDGGTIESQHFTF